MISDWSDLQTILAIARNGSLSAAARELGLNQSTLSRRLQAIEQRADGQVFVRRGDGTLFPSEAGRTLIAAAEKMEAAFLEAKRTLSGSEAPVRIASCEVIAKAVLVPALSKWSSETGGAADLSVHDDLFSLPDNAFDVLVTPLESAPEDMVGHRVTGMKWGLFASPQYLASHPFELGKTDLAGHRVIRSSGSLAEIAACRWFNELGGGVTFSASSPAAQQEAAAAGSGIALLPEAIASEDSRLVQIDFPGTPASDVWIVTRRAAAAQPRVAAFLKWFRKGFAGRHPGTVREQAGLRLQKVLT